MPSFLVAILGFILYVGISFATWALCKVSSDN